MRLVRRRPAKIHDSKGPVTFTDVAGPKPGPPEQNLVAKCDCFYFAGLQNVVSNAICTLTNEILNDSLLL